MNSKLVERLMRLNFRNTHLNIKPVTDISFKKYGRIIEEYDFSEVVEYLEKKTDIPTEGNNYVPSVEAMEGLNIERKVREGFYGNMPIQIGYCNGNNSTLNGLEYHKSSEINVAATDLVLLLGKVQDIKHNKYESTKVHGFYIPKGLAIEIYGTTLHFAPCKIHEDGFKCVVILPRGTNMPLETKIEERVGEEELLFAKNKWLLVHESRQTLIERGAYVGILGDNLEVIF